MSHVKVDRKYGQLEKQFHDKNRFIVGVDSVEDFPDEEAFGGSVCLVYPKGTIERTGAGGYAFWPCFRNPRYMDMVEREVVSDARRFYTPRQFPVIWTPRAEKLKEKREKEGVYLPEKRWTVDQAKKVLEGFRLWWLDPQVDTLAERETAEYIIKEGTSSTQADTFLTEVRRSGLEKWREEYEEHILDSLLSGIQTIKSPASRRGRSNFRSNMDSAVQSMKYYQRVCSELGVRPVDFYFVENLIALRRAGPKNVDFQDVAEVLVNTLMALGNCEMKDYRGFDVKIGRKKAQVASTTFIDGEKVAVTVTV